MLPGGGEEIEIINNFGPNESLNNKSAEKDFEQMVEGLFGPPPGFEGGMMIPIPLGNPILEPVKNPFDNFEVMINGQKIKDPNEIKKDKEMFENMFDGFDFNFNPLNVMKDIHSMNKNLENKYNVTKNTTPEKRLNPMAGMDNIFTDIFGSLQNAFKMPDIFTEDLNKRKQKEKELKNMHNSIKKKSYINSYQGNKSGAKDFGAVLKDEENNGEDILEKIGETLDSAEQVEQNVNIGGALNGIKNGMKDLENLQKLNQEESSDILEVLTGLKSKYENVNKLASQLKKDFKKVNEMKNKLNDMEVGDSRDKQEKKINKLENKLKNNKGI